MSLKKNTSIWSMLSQDVTVVHAGSGRKILGKLKEARGELTALAEKVPEKLTEELVALIRMPWVREPVLNEGRQLRLDRAVNREALLAQTRGVRLHVPCSHCKKGQGPFTVCAAVPGHLNGSCASCHYNNSGSRCSLRSGKLLLVQLQSQKENTQLRSDF